MAEIRKATSADYEAICALLRQLDEHHIAAVPDVFWTYEGQARPRSLVDKAIDDDESDILLAEAEGRAVGLAQLEARARKDIPMMRPARYVLLKSLIVDGAHRGGGIGAELLEAVKEWAREHQIERIQTIVWTGNERAARFYEAHGYAPLMVRMELRIPT